MRRDHTVYLSDQVLELLAEAKHLAAGSSFVFPSHKKPGVSMSSSTINQALRTLAWEGASSSCTTFAEPWRLRQRARLGGSACDPHLHRSRAGRHGDAHL